MDTDEYLVQQVIANERTFDVYRPSSGRSYDGGDTKVGTVAIWVFDASATSNVVTEGVEEETSLTGLLRPSADLQDGLGISDEIRLADDTSRRYEVRTKVGIPNEIAPNVWRLGIERANE